MTRLEQFTRQEIPYGILQRFGLTQEMIDDLPENVMNRFLSSRTTPLLPIETENAIGETVRTLARVSLIRLDDGTVDVCFAPQWVDEDLTAFPKEQQEKLKLGGVAVADMPGHGLCFVQFDDTISQVMAVPTDIINQNISILGRSFGLGDDDTTILKAGGVVEIRVEGRTGDRIVTAGIDLNELTGVRIASGDIIAWQEDAKADRLPRYNFGIYGCWMADDDNVMSYVSEEDFGPELIAEQKRAVSANAARAQLNQLKF